MYGHIKKKQYLATQHLATTNFLSQVLCRVPLLQGSDQATTDLWEFVELTSSWPQRVWKGVPTCG